jgi:hypothetical protein
MVPSTSQERWPSGLRRTLGKRVGVNASPGFESPSLRHTPLYIISLNYLLMPIIPCFLGVYGNKSYGPVHCCPVESNSKCGIKCGINLVAAHTVNKLTAIFVKKAKEPGKYGDGNGLFLHVKLSGAKHWVQRLTVNGKRRDIGLGSASIVSL